LNSKFLNLIFLTFLILSISGCGVKAPPIQHPDTIIDSYVTGYTGTSTPIAPLEPKEDEKAPLPLSISK
jgi:hypothetical protein